VLTFLYLIALVIVLSAILDFAGVSVTQQVAHPVPYPVEHNYYEDTTQAQSQVPAQGNEYSNVDFVITTETIPVKSLLTIDGIRFIFTSFVANLQNFVVVAVVYIAMMGAGVAEGAGLLNALIRKLVEVAPRRIITFLYHPRRRGRERRDGCVVSHPHPARCERLSRSQAASAGRIGGAHRLGLRGRSTIRAGWLQNRARKPPLKRGG